MKTRLSIIAGLLLGAAPLQLNAAEATPVVVAFELLASKHIAMKVKINGKGPYRLIFDTGAPFTLINNRTARDSGMVDKKSRLPWLTVFGSLGVLPIKNLDVGGLKIAETNAVVMDHPTVEMIGRALGPIDGLVGFPFFARFRLTLDYQKQEMAFQLSAFKAPTTDEVVEGIADALVSTARTPRLVQPAGQWGFVPAKDAADDAAGVIIKEIMPKSAADAAGLKAGDRLLTLDGRWTDSVADVFIAAGFIKPGTTIKAVIFREGKQKSLSITPRTGL